MKASQVTKVVTVLVAAFPNSHVTEDTSAVYESALVDLDYEQVDAAVGRLLRTSRFMPSIAEIREAVIEAGSGQPRPGGDAWGDVIAAVHRYGSRRDPVFADPLVGRCVSSFGWEDLCLSENSTADRARFIELYDRIARAQRKEGQASIGARMPKIAIRGNQPTTLADAARRALADVSRGTETGDA